ncbi:hypothetical protein D3C71_1803760 [compost metagenome]
MLISGPERIAFLYTAIIISILSCIHIRNILKTVRIQTIMLYEDPLHFFLFLLALHIHHYKNMAFIYVVIVTLGFLFRNA